MRYLIFPNLSQAEKRSGEEAVARGCSAPTLYWWGFIVHPKTAEAALCIDDAGPFNDAGLTKTEIEGLVLSLDETWFPVT